MPIQTNVVTWVLALLLSGLHSVRSLFSISDCRLRRCCLSLCFPLAFTLNSFMHVRHVRLSDIVRLGCLKPQRHHGTEVAPAPPHRDEGRVWTRWKGIGDAEDGRAGSACHVPRACSKLNRLSTTRAPSFVNHAQLFNPRVSIYLISTKLLFPCPSRTYCPPAHPGLRFTSICKIANSGVMVRVHLVLEPGAHWAGALGSQSLLG